MENISAQNIGLGRNISVVITNLYDLIASINKSLPPDDDDLVTDIVLDLMESGKIRKVNKNKAEERFRCLA